MELTDEYIATFLPQDLSLPMRKGFLDQLRKFPGEMDYYYSYQNEQFLQGDVYGGFVSFNQDTGQKKEIRGIILSNTCDISGENARWTAPRVVYAPIIRLSKLASMYEQAGISTSKITSKLESIKKQEVTHLFYLPQGDMLDDDYVALLDAIEHTSTEHLYQKCKRVATLGMAGFYMFLFKLSIHFTRMHEGVIRQTA